MITPALICNQDARLSQRKKKRYIASYIGGGGVLPYMGYIGMCGPKGYGFSAVLVIKNRVSILADFSHFGHK